MVIPDAIGIIPVVANPLTWCIRVSGLWLSAFVLWAFGFMTTLYLARFVGGGILVSEKGIKLSRFSKIIEWRNIKALTLDTQPIFSLLFGLAGNAKRLLIFEEKPTAAGNNAKLSPHPVPSFQFSTEDFTSLFAHICEQSMQVLPHSTEAYIFPQEKNQFLQMSSQRAAKLRLVLSVIIAVGLLTFLGRRASLNYFYNHGTANFRQGKYIAAVHDFETATKIDQTFASGWDQLARSEFRCGDVHKAEQHWQRALQMKPDLVEAKVGLSNILINHAEYEKAELLLEQCAVLSPHNCAIYLNQVVLYKKTGQTEKAQKMLGTVFREAANDPAVIAKATAMRTELNKTAADAK